MSRNYIPGLDTDYKFTRSEFALFVGLSPNAVRMKMRRGYYANEYVKMNGKYLFKRPRVIMGERPPVDHPRSSLSTPGPMSLRSSKRKVKRGNHYEANYPNQSMKNHNTYKKLKAVGADEQFINEYEDLKKIQHLQKQKELQESLRRTQKQENNKRNLAMRPSPIQNM